MSEISKTQVINDVADAYREASGTSDKVPVGQLANKVKSLSGGVVPVDSERLISQFELTETQTSIIINTDMEGKEFALRELVLFGDLQIDTTGVTSNLMLDIRTDNNKRHIMYLNTFPYASGRIHFCTHTHYDEFTDVTSSRTNGLESLSQSGTMASKIRNVITFGVEGVTTIKDLEICVINANNKLPIKAGSRITLRGKDA